MSIIAGSRKGLIIFILAIFLTGCINQSSSVEKMYQVLEEVVSAEKTFEEQQEPIVVLEKQEKAIYNQIMTLGMKQHDQIVGLADEALEIVEKRKGHLQKEKESLLNAEKKFEKIADIKKDISDQDQKELADELYDIMMQRYAQYKKISDEYSTALTYDHDLYMMIKKSNISFNDLEDQVTKLNQTYKKVYEANENFNQLTSEYNEKKLEFYKKSGLKLEK